MKKINFYGSLYALLQDFLKKKLLDCHSYLGWECFPELLSSNIMKYDKNDIEWQQNISVMYDTYN